MVYHRVARDPKSDEVALEAHGDAVTRLAKGKACAPHEFSPVYSIANGKAMKPHAFGEAVRLCASAPHEERESEYREVFIKRVRSHAQGSSKRKWRHT